MNTRPRMITCAKVFDSSFKRSILRQNFEWCVLVVNPKFDREITDLIYEAAIVPERWESALDMLAKRVDAAGAALFMMSGVKTDTSVWSKGLDGLVTGWLAGGWQAKTQRAPRMMALDRAGFVIDSDIYLPGEMEKDEALVDYLRPTGFGHGAGTGIAMPTGEVAVISVERQQITGPFMAVDRQVLDQFRPHLARAALMTGRAGMDRARAMAATFESLGIPGAIVRPNSALLAANSEFQKLLPKVFEDRRGGLGLVNSRCNTLFRSALLGLQKNSYDCVTSIPLPATEEHTAMIVHVLPVRGVAHDLVFGGVAAVLVTPVDQISLPTTHVLQGLFDLTPAEARVAKEIAKGQSSAIAASSLGIGRETLRSQLAAVFAKTGVRRQAELVSLLSGKWWPK